MRSSCLIEKLEMNCIPINLLAVVKFHEGNTPPWSSLFQVPALSLLQLLIISVDSMKECLRLNIWLYKAIGLVFSVIFNLVFFLFLWIHRAAKKPFQRSMLLEWPCFSLPGHFFMLLQYMSSPRWAEWGTVTDLTLLEGEASVAWRWQPWLWAASSHSSCQ